MVNSIALFVAVMPHQAMTVTLQPTPMPVALRLLSAASGKVLVASKSLANEVVVAQLQDAPVDDVLAHLAESLCARWQIQGDGSMVLIEASASLRNLLRAQEIEDGKSIDDSLRRIGSRLAGKTSAPSGGDGDQESGPGARVAEKLVLLIGSADLRTISEGTQEVWAENPTTFQHPFPPGSDDVLAEFREERRRVNPQDSGGRAELIIQKRFDRSENVLSFNITLQSRRASGKYRDDGFIRFNVENEQKEAWLNRIDGVGNTNSAKQQVTLSGQILEARRALAYDSQTPNSAKLKLLETWRSRLLDPVKYEPLQWHEGADLLAAAKAVHRNMIGTIGDDIDATNWDPKPLTAEEMLDKWKSDLLPSSDGWLVVRSRRRTSRISRLKAMEFLRDCVRTGGVTVEAAAAWAASSKDFQPFESWVGDYLTALFPWLRSYNALDTIGGDFHIWNSLGPEVHTALEKGERVDLNALSADAQDWILYAVYQRDDIDGNDIEPTDRVPDGISGGSLRLTMTERPVFVAWNSQNGPPITPIALDSLAMGQDLANAESGATYALWDPRRWDRFRIGVHRTYLLHFQLQPGNIAMTESYSETIVDPNGKVVDQLPEKMRAEVEKARVARLSKLGKPHSGNVVPPN